jgi:hypothetical protein
LEDLNHALQTWVMVKAALPQHVHELTNIPALQGKRLPTPPPGRKLAIDRTRRQVTWVDE